MLLGWHGTSRWEFGIPCGTWKIHEIHWNPLNLRYITMLEDCSVGLGPGSLKVCRSTMNGRSCIWCFVVKGTCCHPFPYSATVKNKASKNNRLRGGDIIYLSHAPRCNPVPSCYISFLGLATFAPTRTTRIIQNTLWIPLICSIPLITSEWFIYSWMCPSRCKEAVDKGTGQESNLWKFWRFQCL